jgi:hypothetical protein
MNRFLHLFASLLMVAAVANSLFTRGPLMESVSFSLEVEREGRIISQDHFLVTPHLPFLFTFEQSSSGLDIPTPGLPLSNINVTAHGEKPCFKFTGAAIVKTKLRVDNFPIYLRVRSLRN